MRPSLAQAKSVAGLNKAAAAEARKITGRDISIDMTGSHLETAKEHSEGILQALERFPNASLNNVRVQPLDDNVYAHAAGSTVVFNQKFASSSGREEYLHSLTEDAKGWEKGLQVYGINDLKIASFHTRNSGSPRAVALHEMGHVVHIATTRERSNAAVDAVVKRETAREQRRQTLPGARVKDSGDLVLRTVSGYAMKSRHELVAEAFTDVMLNGSGASRTSKGIFDALEKSYQASHA